MDGTRPGEPLTGSVLDREIESALGIEPSPEFLARVRTRVATEPEPSPWRLAGVVTGFSGTRRWAVEPLWGVAIVGIVLAVVVPQLMREEPVRPNAETSPPVEAGRQAGLVRQSVETAAIQQRPVAARSRAEGVHMVPLQLSPVLFAEEDRLAFASFVTAVAAGRVPERVVQTLGDEDLTVLAIEPLVIAPLPPLARLAQQGENQW